MSKLKPWTHYVQYMYMNKSRSMYFFSPYELFVAAFLFVTLFENLIIYSSTLAAARKTTQKYVDMYAIRLKYEIYIFYTYDDNSLATFFSNLTARKLARNIPLRVHTSWALSAYVAYESINHVSPACVVRSIRRPAELSRAWWCRCESVELIVYGKNFHFLPNLVRTTLTERDCY